MTNATTSAPTVAVLCGGDGPPPGMTRAEHDLEVRYVDAAGLGEGLRGAEVLFLWDFFSGALADAWSHADRLRWVHVASAGVDAVLTRDLVDSDVVLTNSRGVFERPIAEYVLGLLLSFAKDFPRSWDLQRARTWQHRQTEVVTGRRAVVVGTGPIGREIAALLSAVGLEVRLVGRTRRTDPLFGEVQAIEDLPSVVADADFVVGAAPLTEQTRGVFDRKVFEAMPRSARLVNVGRGPSVVEPDLIAALREQEIAGAALDVFADEPLPPDSPLWHLDGVIVSPHMSGDRHGWREALADLFLDNLGRWRAGDPLRNVVDKALGYVPGSRSNPPEG
jgi:phosphoglycerate dehydrogenase-like enzyme